MVIYAVIAIITKRFRLREDRVGDNIYYLGFLFTLISLAYALYVYNNPGGSGGAAEIITNFGIAIFTTIFGLAGRVLFNQMRQDPVEYEREARYSLAEASLATRRDTGHVCKRLLDAGRSSLSCMKGVVFDWQNLLRKAIFLISYSAWLWAPISNAVIGLVFLRHRNLNLAPRRHDLPRTGPRLRHDPGSSPSSFSHIAWTKKARSGHWRTSSLLRPDLGFRYTQQPAQCRSKDPGRR